jgi:hypothetical protein
MLGTIIAKQRTKIPMQQPFSNSHFNNRRQAYVLLLLGVVFLTVAWLGMLNSYSLGVLFFGLGMLGAALFNPGRFLQVGWLMTWIGVATLLIFDQYIPGNQALTAHILAIGLGLLGIAWMARHGYAAVGALTPSLFVVGVGVAEYFQAAHLTPTPFLHFALSLWLPGSGLLVLGLVSLATSASTMS